MSGRAKGKNQRAVGGDREGLGAWKNTHAKKLSDQGKKFLESLENEVRSTGGGERRLRRETVVA